MKNLLLVWLWTLERIWEVQQHSGAYNSHANPGEATRDTLEPLWNWGLRTFREQRAGIEDNGLII